jgi:hypothetical protein
MKLALIFLICITFFFSQEEKGFKYDVYSQIYGRYELIRNAPIFSTFKLARVLFGGEGTINDQTEYKFEFILAEKAELNHIFLDFKFDPAFKVRAGQFKYPFGLEGYESGKTFKFINKSTVSNEIAKKLGNDGADYRDIGVNLFGDLKIVESLKYSYNFSIFNGNGKNTEDNVDYMSFIVNNSFSYDVIKLGIAYYKGNSVQTKTVTDKYDEKAINVFLVAEEKDNYKVQAETFVQNLSANIGLLPDYNSNGYYISANYFIDEKIELGARYGQYISNLIDKTSIEQSLNVAYHISKKFRLTLELENRTYDYQRSEKYKTNDNHSQVLYLQVHTNL